MGCGNLEKVGEIKVAFQGLIKVGNSLCLLLPEILFWKHLGGL
jgi:hypothetical protein